MKRYIIPAVLLLLFIAACAPRPTVTNDQAAFNPERDREELVGSTWTVDRVYGQEITASEGRERAFLTFTDDGKVQGHTGCNPINGTYELADGLRISFDNVATGLALCEDVTYERDFLDVLNDTDNYTLNDGTLSLNKARMAPMAILKKSK